MVKAEIHPNYLSSGGKHDIGLIKLLNLVNLNSNIKLIRLHVNNKETLLNQTAYLTGFGLINGNCNAQNLGNTS